jgi:penicillin amidase
MDFLFRGGVSKRSRIIFGLLGVSLIAVLAIVLFLRYQVRKSFPLTSGSIVLPSLQDTLHIFRDEFGAPLIQARNEHDLMFALGFVHAEDRLWQMDLSRRAGEGRLSEIFGGVTVPFDKMFRIIGIARVAREIERTATPQSLNRLQWYADGVNQFIEQYRGRYPVEFDMLRYEPEPWKPYHSLVIAQMMAWELNMAWWTDLTLGVIAGKVGLEKALDIFPSYPDNVPPIVPDHAARRIASSSSAILDICLAYQRFIGSDGGATGSNAWVVSPSKSASGKVILANDTHLHLQIPSKWHEAHLQGAGYDVGGMTIPGIPGVAAGHNADIAWGVTNMMADEADFYVEHIDTLEGTRYLYEDRWLPLEIREEEIAVKGDNSLSVIIRSTHHGPIVTDIETPLQKSRSPFVASMRWTGYETADRVEAFNKINRARNWQQFLAGVQEFSGPGQNFVYGDRQGNIGYWCGVKLPIRGRQSSTLPLPGWTEASEWRGFVPFEDLPHLYNPPEGFIATANNKIAGEGYPYHISDLWEPPSRIQRIREVLGTGALFTVQDFQRLQNDMVSVYAREMLPIVLEACADDALGLPEQARVLEYLKNWDFVFSKEDIATSLFQEFLVRLLTNLYADEMGDELLHDFVILGNIPLRVTAALVSEGTSKWFDDVRTTEVETRRDMLRKSMKDAVNALRERFGTDMKTWRWGEMHTVTLQHPFGLQKPLDRVFNLGPFKIGGGPTAVMSAEYSFNKPFEVTVGASFRMIVDFARSDEIYVVLPSGQSGQVFHDHYDDQTPLWLNGAYRIFQSHPSAAALPALRHLVLEPGS